MYKCRNGAHVIPVDGAAVTDVRLLATLVEFVGPINEDVEFLRLLKTTINIQFTQNHTYFK